MLEAERFSPEVEAAFKEWIKARGIKAILFDFDDTLIDTNTIFKKQMEVFLECCLECAPHVDPDEFRVEYKKADDLSYELIGVDPRKWDFVVAQLIEKYGEEGFKEGLKALHEIYTMAPNIFDGVRETLEICRSVGLRLGLVTHANKPWTDIKLAAHGLNEYFEYVKVVDFCENKYKGPEHWQEAIKEFEVEPESVMVIGDSLRGDVDAAHKAGVRTLVWIPSKWHLLNKGDKPSGIYEVDEIGNLILTLLGQN